MKTAGNRNPALVELILVILFFALSSVILVQVFVTAHGISRTSHARTEGLVLIQDLIEQWKSNPAQPETIFCEENGWVLDTSSDETRQRFRTDLGESMEKTDGQAFYQVHAELTRIPKDAGILYEIQVTVTRTYNQETVTQISTSQYVPQEAAT